MYLLCGCFNYLLVRYLFEYMWRERIRRSGADLLTSFLKLIAENQRIVTPPDDHLKVFFYIQYWMLITRINNHFTLQYFETLWDCPYCGHECSLKEEQRIHLQRDCTERPSWDDSCPYCGLDFPSKASLATHQSRWCNERPAK